MWLLLHLLEAEQIAWQWPARHCLHDVIPTGWRDTLALDVLHGLTRYAHLCHEFVTANEIEYFCDCFHAADYNAIFFLGNCRFGLQWQIYYSIFSAYRSNRMGATPMPDFTYKFDVESDNGLSIEGVAGSFDLTWEQGDTSVGEASGPILTACEFVSFMFGALKIDRYLLMDILSETEVEAIEADAFEAAAADPDLRESA